MLAKICSRRKMQTEFSDDFFAAVLRVKYIEHVNSWNAAHWLDED